MREAFDWVVYLRGCSTDGSLRHADRLVDRDVHKQEDPLGCKLNLIVPRSRARDQPDSRTETFRVSRVKGGRIAGGAD
jgi:hypothetical protein